MKEELYIKGERVDLKNIDYTIPVYIERYAAFFAIISIRSQGDYSECELLKLLL